MIDLHTHVLPALDDGPAKMAASVQTLRLAARDGVRTLAATPHLRKDYPEVRPAEIAARCAELQRAVGSTDIRVVPGAEVDLRWAQAASDADLRCATLGGNGHDLLVETPYGELPGTFEDLLFNLTLRRFRTILAHPERSAAFQRDPGRLKALVDRGVLVQVTGSALVKPARRSRSHKLATALVREGMAHTLGSDAHGPGPWRPPGLSQAYAAIAQVDRRLARWMVDESPAAILAGEPLPSRPAVGSWVGLRARLAGR